MTYMGRHSVFSVQTQTVEPIPILSCSPANVFKPYTGFPSISTANPFHSYMRFAGKPYPYDVCGMFQYPSIDIPCISRMWKTNKGKKSWPVCRMARPTQPLPGSPYLTPKTIHPNHFSRIPSFPTPFGPFTTMDVAMEGIGRVGRPG
jgi:hypothetical protein